MIITDPEHWCLRLKWLDYHGIIAQRAPYKTHNAKRAWFVLVFDVIVYSLEKKHCRSGTLPTTTFQRWSVVGVGKLIKGSSWSMVDYLLINVQKVEWWQKVMGHLVSGVILLLFAEIETKKRDNVREDDQYRPFTCRRRVREVRCRCCSCVCCCCCCCFCCVCCPKPVIHYVMFTSIHQVIVGVYVDGQRWYVT